MPIKVLMMIGPRHRLVIGEISSRGTTTAAGATGARGDHLGRSYSGRCRGRSGGGGRSRLRDVVRVQVAVVVVVAGQVAVVAV